MPIDAVEIYLFTPFPGTPLWDNPAVFGMRIIDHNFDYYTTKKYVMESLRFPRTMFVPAFKVLLKRLNMIPTPGHYTMYPEIYDFLERDIKLQVWKEERSGIGKLLRL